MQEMREGFFQETQGLRNEMQKKQLELRGLWAQTPPDQTQILKKQGEINTLREQLQEKGIQHRLKMRKILTPEQQAQMGTYGPGYGRGYGRMGGGFGPGRGMGFGNCPRW
jgi:Spy/CpxP family protein refolding chaperone